MYWGNCDLCRLLSIVRLEISRRLGWFCMKPRMRVTKYAYRTLESKPFGNYLEYQDGDGGCWDGRCVAGIPTLLLHGNPW
jgi:hypothetical protein